MKKHLNIEKMRIAASKIVGIHDFACFQAAGGNIRETTVRTVYALQIDKDENEKITIQIKGDGFLYNMVRIIVGTLVDIGTGKLAVESITGIIESKDRRNAGHTAPARGLYLAEVYYDKTEL